MNIKDHIPLVPDWPKPGVNFLDINGIFVAPHVLDHCCNQMSHYVKAHRTTGVVAVESRGFIMASILARMHGFPLVLARKEKKLPGPVYRVSYKTEYSQDVIEIQTSAPVGDRPFIIDDVAATGGTILAVAQILRDDFRCEHIAAGVIANLDFLPGRKMITAAGIPLISLVDYE